MVHTLTIRTTRYAPWEDGADERERLGVDTETVEIESDEDETLAEAVHRELEKRGLTSFSEEGPGVDGSHDGWFYDPDGYEHPYDGTYEESSGHLSDDFTPDERRAVFGRTILLRRRPLPDVTVITDAQARVAASQYQSPGDGIPLFELASTGFISRYTEQAIDREVGAWEHGTAQQKTLTELKNYVRIHGVRPSQHGWSTKWDGAYEQYAAGPVVLDRDHEMVGNFRTPSEALHYIHARHSYSASHALAYEGYRLVDAEGTDISDTYIHREDKMSSPPRDDTPSYDGIQRAFHIARAQHGLPPLTSEDAPRDASQPSTGRTPLMSAPSGEITGLTTALAYVTELKNYLEDPLPKVETFVAGLQENEVGGPALEALGRMNEHLAAAANEAAQAYNALDERTQVKEAMDGVEGPVGREAFIRGE